MTEDSFLDSKNCSKNQRKKVEKKLSYVKSKIERIWIEWIYEISYMKIYKIYENTWNIFP